MTTEWREKYGLELVFWVNTRLVLGKDGTIYLYNPSEEPEMCEIGKCNIPDVNDVIDLLYPFTTRVA